MARRIIGIDTTRTDGFQAVGWDDERQYQFRVHASPISVRAAVFVFTSMERIRPYLYWLHFDIRQAWIGAKRRVRGA